MNQGAGIKNSQGILILLSRKETRVSAQGILFHPDFHRRPWIYTRSADLHNISWSARGLSGWKSGLPPVGNFTPPWE